MSNEELTPEIIEVVEAPAVEEVVAEPTPEPEAVVEEVAVVEPTPEPEPEVAVEVVPEPAPVVVPETPKKKGTTPIAVNIDDVRAELPEPAGVFVVGNGVVDEVSLSKIVYKNELARKSLSVHHLQRRLNELGYTDAYADKDGYFGDKTRLAILKYQENNKFAVDGKPTKELLEQVFNGDPNVKVVD